jgi:ATP-dependent DNA helicase RecQ
VIDVLTGKVTDKVTQFGHDRLPTFGVGADIAAAEWRGIVRQLVAMGYLAVDLEGYGGLRLSQPARRIEGEQRVTLREASRRTKGRRRGTAERSRDRNAIAAARRRTLAGAARNATRAIEGARRPSVCDLPRCDPPTCSPAGRLTRGDARDQRRGSASWNGMGRRSCGSFGAHAG